MRRTVLLAALLVAASACATGPRMDRHPITHQPRGANVTLETRSGNLTAELLEVRDTALLVLTAAGRVTLVPYRTIRSSTMEIGREVTRGGRTPTPGRRLALSRLSRFPQGLRPELLTALLRAYGQTEPEVVER